MSRIELAPTQSYSTFWDDVPVEAGFDLPSIEELEIANAEFDTATDLEPPASAASATR